MIIDAREAQMRGSDEEAGKMRTDATGAVRARQLLLLLLQRQDY